MNSKLPQSTEELMSLTWSDFEALYQEVESVVVTADNVQSWLSDWTRVTECVDEQYQRLYVAISLNTADKATEDKFNKYLDTIYANAQSHEQILKEKLLATGLEPKGFQVPLRNMRSEAGLFRETNLPLLTEEQKLATEFDKINGAQTVDWDGAEVTVYALSPYLQSPDRSIRERAWKAEMARIYADRDAINALWVKNLELRQQIAKNADKPDYRAYKWQQSYRFDYSPQDCMAFHNAIEQVVVPAVSRLMKAHKDKLGVDTLRPWDIDIKNYVDPLNQPTLKPYETVDEQISITQNIFNNIDPTLGGYFKDMRDNELMDVPNRKNKAPGAYCTSYNRIRKPYIVCNSVGTQDDVSTLIHESGHAFHVYESAGLPYMPQLNVTMEFAEVASMAMELLAYASYNKNNGGFYSTKDVGRALSQHLITSLMFWPYMSVVDSFQHWVYENPGLAANPDLCDQTWNSLWDRFMPDQDWSGFEQYRRTGWHRKPHIHQVPFYYIEYGLALLGAVQVWGNSLQDKKKAVADYRKALALGGTETLPNLYKIAGAKLAFDADTLKINIDLMMKTILELEQVE